MTGSNTLLVPTDPLRAWQTVLTSVGIVAAHQLAAWTVRPTLHERPVWFDGDLAAGSKLCDELGVVCGLAVPR